MEGKPDVTSREAKIRRRRLIRERPPDPQTLASIDRVEASDDFDGLSLEAMAEFCRALLPGRIHGYGASLPADEPTDAPPGSKAKILAMQRRAELGQSLFHPRDAKSPS